MYKNSTLGSVERWPERWSGATRNWKLKDEVWLNPERDLQQILKEAA